MAKYASFRELIVWQKGMDLSEKVHHATESLAARLSWVPPDAVRDLELLAQEIGRMLFGRWRSLFVGGVCYSLSLLALCMTLGPWIIGRFLSLGLGA
jgi:hypothetical protein